ncbi:MAG: pilin [Patescibacteria group bacterium]
MLTTLLAQAANLGEGFSADTGYGAEDLSTSTAVCSSIEQIISNTIGFITALAGIIFIAYFIWGAIDWITSGGDSGKVGNARNKMTQGVIGLILVVASYGIIGLIGTVTGLDILNPCEQLEGITAPGEKSGLSESNFECAKKGEDPSVHDEGCCPGLSSYGRGVCTDCIPKGVTYDGTTSCCSGLKKTASNAERTSFTCE